MDAIQMIEQNLDIERILDHYKFDNVRPSGNFLRACCAIHGGDNPMSFVINQDSGLWSCHSQCGNGNIFHLVQKMEDIRFPQAVYRVAEILGLDIQELKIIASDAKEKKELKTWLKVMKEMLKDRNMESFEPVDEYKKVKTFKDFLPETIEKFGLFYFDKFQGLNRSGEPFITYQRLAFPIIQQGKTVGMSLRATNDKQVPKWLHQPSHISTSELLYNYDSAIGQDEVTIVEGITDVWAYHEIGVTAIATYGAHITDEQKRMLLRLGSKLIFSFDGDRAGREITEKAIEMFKYTTDYRVVQLPEGTDPESIKRKELNEIWKQSR